MTLIIPKGNWAYVYPGQPYEVGPTATAVVTDDGSGLLMVYAKPPAYGKEHEVG